MGCLHGGQEHCECVSARLDAGADCERCGSGVPAPGSEAPTATSGPWLEGDLELGTHRAGGPPPERPAQPAPRADPGLGRMCVLDNAKFVLIVCVVLTHLLAPLEGSHMFSRTFAGARFAFMMPAFTFISGYCSSPDVSKPPKLHGNLKVIAIYALAQLMWLVLARYEWWGLWRSTCWGNMIYGNAAEFRTGAESGTHQQWKLEDWGHPFFHLWYLFSLIFWRLALPYWWRLHYPVVTSWVAAALFCGLNLYQADPFSSWMLDVKYIVAYFPLFCLGVAGKQEKWELWESRWSVPAGVAAVAIIAWVPVVFAVPGDYGNGVIWAYGTRLHNLVGGEGWGGNLLMVLFRLLVPLAHVIGIWGFLHMMPRRKIWLITGCGERCLATYVFHLLGGMLISAMGVYGSSCDGQDAPFWAELAIVVFAVFSALFWSSRLMWKVLWPILDPPVHLFLRSD